MSLDWAIGPLVAVTLIDDDVRDRPRRAACGRRRRGSRQAARPPRRPGELRCHSARDRRSAPSARCRSRRRDRLPDPCGVPGRSLRPAAHRARGRHDRPVDRADGDARRLVGARRAAAPARSSAPDAGRSGCAGRPARDALHHPGDAARSPVRRSRPQPSQAGPGGAPARSGGGARQGPQRGDARARPRRPIGRNCWRSGLPGFWAC